MALMGLGEVILLAFRMPEKLSGPSGCAGVAWVVGRCGLVGLEDGILDDD